MSTRPGLIQPRQSIVSRLANAVRSGAVLLPALFLSLAMAGYSAMSGARVEELGEVSGYACTVVAIWAICRYDPELLRLGVMLAALGYLWLVSV